MLDSWSFKYAWGVISEDKHVDTNTQTGGGGGTTSFISLFNNVESLSRYTKGKWKYRDSDPQSSGMVAFVSKEKLDSMEIFCATSRSLVEDVGATCWSPTNRDGVSYASNEHFMVYGWIPLQCIEEVVSLARFERRCSRISEAATGDTSGVEPRQILAHLDSVGDDAVEDLARNLQQTL